MLKKIQKNKDIDAETFKNIIIKGIQEKKGLEIVLIDLKQIHTAVSDYFVVCHGSSTTQVSALADSVEMEVKKATGIFPYHKEGHTNAEWIILDYFDLVVHIFLESARDFYKLENLWADAVIEKIDDKYLEKNKK